jgi:aspartate kinase
MPQIVVQSMAGTSVGDLERSRRWLRAFRRTLYTGPQGRGDGPRRWAAPPTLSSRWPKRFSARPDRRELDMLMATGEQQSVALLALTLHKLAS